MSLPSRSNLRTRPGTPCVRRPATLHARLFNSERAPAHGMPAIFATRADLRSGGFQVPHSMLLRADQTVQ